MCLVEDRSLDGVREAGEGVKWGRGKAGSGCPLYPAIINHESRCHGKELLGAKTILYFGGSNDSRKDDRFFSLMMLDEAVSSRVWIPVRFILPPHEDRTHAEWLDDPGSGLARDSMSQGCGRSLWISGCRDLREIGMQ